MSQEPAANGNEEFDVKLFLKSNSLLILLADMLKDRLMRGGYDSGTPPFGDAEANWEQMHYFPRAAWAFNEEVYAAYAVEGLSQATRAMDALDALLRRDEIPLTIVVYPWPAQILEGDLDSEQARHRSQ